MYWSVKSFNHAPPCDNGLNADKAIPNVWKRVGIKSSSSGAGLGDGEALALDEGERLALGETDGEAELDGETDGLILGETELEGEALGLIDALGLILGETELEGLAEDEGERDGLTLLEGETDALGDRLALGLTDGLTLLEGEILADGLTEGETLAEGEIEADGLTEADGEMDALGLPPASAISIATAADPAVLRLDQSQVVSAPALSYCVCKRLSLVESSVVSPISVKPLPGVTPVKLASLWIAPKTIAVDAGVLSSVTVRVVPFPVLVLLCVTGLAVLCPVTSSTRKSLWRLLALIFAVIVPVPGLPVTCA